MLAKVSTVAPCTEVEAIETFKLHNSIDDTEAINCTP